MVGCFAFAVVIGLRQPFATRENGQRFIAKGAIFVAAAALCIAALIALSFIRSDEMDYARARNAKSTKQSDAKGSASKLAGGKPAVPSGRQA